MWGDQVEKQFDIALKRLNQFRLGEDHDLFHSSFSGEPDGELLLAPLLLELVLDYAGLHEFSTGVAGNGLSRGNWMGPLDVR